MTELSPVKRALIEIERLQGELDLLRQRQHEPLAVVGLACRFPGGAVDPDAFWALVADGRDAIAEIPADRWNNEAFFDVDGRRPGSISTQWGGFLRDIDQFDAAFFGISPREAAAMDPQQRLLLEVAWEAFEAAGLPAESLSGSATGVFAGVCSSDYERLHFRRLEDIDIYSGTGTVPNVIGGRLAYLFNLRGPAIVLDTACSSSLVAVHMACRSLRSRESDIALAAGVNLFVLPERHVCASRMRMLAPDGRCKSFDARADGFVRSEGCGAVVLKRLSDAIASGDPIRAVIRGSAVNQDGRSAGLTAPNGQAQIAVIRRALADAGVDPADIDYVETHGAGTSLGDPIEVESLASVYGHPADRPCLLGAVKTNVGHTEAAAGVAALIKTVLALEHQSIPRNLHFERLNPNVSLEGTRLEIAARERPWPRGERPRRAAVSSFGWSGTNAHVIVEESPRRERAAADARGWYLLPVSARSRDALGEMVDRYAAAIARTDIGDLVYTAGVRRTHHPIRLAAVGGTAEELAAALRRAPIAQDGEGGGLAFVYPGQGGQWPGMGRELLAHEPVFRRAIKECDEAIHARAGWHLVDALRSDAPWDDIARIQPALFALGLALTQLWEHWGLRPDAVVGHSLGEVTAARVAGALSLEDAVSVICARSALLRRLRGAGAMAVVELARDATEAALAAVAGRVSVAASNSARSTVVSGDATAIDALLGDWERAGVYCRRVQVDVASHSPQVDALRGELERTLSGVKPHGVSVRMISTVTGEDLSGLELDGTYWARNLREPVRFVDAVQRLRDDGCRTYVEVGPHPVLLGAIQESLDARGIALPSMRRAESERRVLLQTLGLLYERGLDVSWQHVNGTGNCVRLPAYAWQRSRYWLDTQKAPSGGSRRGPLAVGGRRGLHVCQIEHAGGHSVLGRDVMPAAGYIERALRDAGEILGWTDAEARNVAFHQPLDTGVDAQLVIEEVDGGAQFAVHSRPDHGAGWQTHASGHVTAQTPPRPERRLDLAAVQRRCTQRVDGSEFYARMARAGVEYAGPFRQVARAWVGTNEVLTELEHANLDACLQGLWWAGGWTTEQVRVPVRVGRAAVASDVAGAVWAWARWRQGAGEVLACAADGRIVAEISGLELATLTGHAEWLWEMQWVPEPPVTASGTLAGRWLVVGVDDRLASRLRERGASVEVAATETPIATVASGLDGIVWLADGDNLDRLVTCARALTRDPAGQTPRLWLVTRGTQAAGAGARQADGAGHWGLAQVIRHEHPRLRTTCVDLPIAPTAEDLDRLVEEISSGGAESHVALRHDGRFVARLARLRSLLPKRLELSPDATYLITGGLGGLGLAVAARLAARGARHLALIGRSQASDRAATCIQALDAHVRTFQADVSSPTELAAALEQIAADMPPVRGVVHAAGILDDVTLLNLTADRLEAVARPKVAGASHLHDLLSDAALDWFVLFSSAASILGSPGQASYAAANSYLDAFAHMRRSLGLPALSINWGRWAGTGLAADASHAERLAGNGIGAMAADDALDLFESLIANGCTQAAVMSINFRQWSERFPHVASLPVFRGVIGEPPAAAPTRLAADLRSMAPDDRVEALEQVVRAEAESVMRLEPGTLSGDASFFTSGMDSMTALELRNRLENHVALTMPATVIWQFPNARGLAAHLSDALAPARREPDPAEDVLLARVIEAASQMEL